MSKIAIRYKSSMSDKWLAESISMATSGPQTVWVWVSNINLATHITVGILPDPIGMFAIPHNVSIETKITDLGEFEL